MRCSIFSCIKYSLPTIPDWEMLFIQTQEFIYTCNGEQVRYATDSCKYALERRICYDEMCGIQLVSGYRILQMLLHLVI